jgi:hypothetical protein
MLLSLQICHYVMLLIEVYSLQPFFIDIFIFLGSFMVYLVYRSSSFESSSIALPFTASNIWFQ